MCCDDQETECQDSSWLGTSNRCQEDTMEKITEVIVTWNLKESKTSIESNNHAIMARY
jgi:hypothetical protein